MSSVIDNSYERQRREEQSYSDLEQLPSVYSDPGSVDGWHHHRMHEMLQPLLTTQPGSTWLTIGDGRFGSDAHYLRANGMRATASSLTDGSLAVAKARGWIDDYRAENAEHLSLPDGAVDYVLIKEALHHLPRPAIGVYEMLRVARQGVALIEPQETGARLLDLLKRTAKRLLRGDPNSEYEPAGNYVYRLSVRECEKQMLSLNLPAIAWRKFNVFYLTRLGGGRCERLSWPGMATRAGVVLQDILCRLGLLDYGMACVVMFTSMPEADTIASMRAAGFRVRMLPRNPYA